MSCVGGGTLVSIIKNERPGWVSSPGALTAFLAAGCAGYYGVCKRGLSRPWVKKVSGAADLVALGGAAVAAGKEVVSGKGNLVTAALSASLCSVGGGLCCDVINGKPPSAFTRSARAFVVPPIIGAWLYPVVYNPRHPNAAVLLTVAATIGLHKALAPHSAKK